MHQHHTLNYVEFATTQLETTKQFFTQVFDWRFEDYGPEYSAFNGQGLDGGFYAMTASKQIVTSTAPLLVLYSRDLENSQIQVEAAGGYISKAIFEFPGGRRFHFTEPGGNELAVWSE